jgi:hypothetical protein
MSDSDKKPKFVNRPSRPQVEPKLTITKRVTGTWGVDVRFFDQFPKDFGNDTHPRF